MEATREQALQVIAGEGLEIPGNSLNNMTAHALLNDAAHLEPSKRRLVAIELAVRLWLKSLSISYTYYAEFESVLWLHFSQETNPEEQIRTITTPAKIGANVTRLYHKHLRNMFLASKKTRNDFYQCMLIEAGLQMNLYDADFGEKAMKFHEVARTSIHSEHLLVFYLTSLLIRTYTATRPKCSLSIADDELEMMYRYFEKKVPLSATFSRLATDRCVMENVYQELFPLTDSKDVFYSLEFCNRDGFFDFFLSYLRLCTVIYEVEARKRESLNERITLMEVEAEESVDSAEESCHFNCFALCQSSGLGKSKNVSALRDVPEFYVFDICLREDGEPGEPSRTPMLADAVKACRSRRDILRVFSGCLGAQLASLRDPRKPSLLDRVSAGSNPHGATSELFWKAAKEAAYGNELEEASLIDECRNLLGELLSLSGRKTVIFSLDEAASLCEERTADGGSTFQDFLEALAVFPSGVFGIVLDTSSRVHDFAPKRSCTQAAEEKGQPAILFPLFFCLPTHGILEVPEVLSDMDTITHPRKGSQFAGLKSNFFVVAFETRPSFGAYVQGNLELATTPEGRSALMAKVISMASRKLGLSAAAVAVEASRSGPAAQRVKDDLSLALLSTRLGMLSLDHAGVANLVANHMATLVGVSQDTSVLYAQYVVEPIIAIAAFGEMAAEGRVGQLLDSIGSLLASGGASSIFATGDAGEFVASFMLMRAYDYALQLLLADATIPSYVGMPVTLGSYLEALLGPAALLRDGKSWESPLLDGFVCVLQTAIIEEKLEPSDLLEAFRLRYGIICRKGEYAVDFVIPVVLPSKKEKSIHDLTSRDMTGLLVQVKNWQTGEVPQSEITEVFRKIHNFASDLLPDLDHISLLMAVGKGAVGGSLFEKTSRGGLEIVLSAIDSAQSPCLASTTAGRLREIAAGGTRQARVERSNQATYAGLDPTLVRQMTRRLQRQPCRTIAPRECRSPPAPTRPSRPKRAQESAGSTTGQVPEKIKRRAPRN